MCGLVLAGARYNLSSTDIELFAKLLYVDTFRGEHSTGVFSLFKPYGQPTTTRVVKEAVPGPFFIANDDLWNESTSMEYISGYNKVKTKAFPKVMFGHNRYATRGKINTENAHPFVHEHITLAHNGTLRDQSLLPDYKDFEVDSNNICYSIAKIGADETIQKLKGAFTLIWHDANLNTLNVIRNTERPFHFAELTCGDWFGASEEWMLMGILGRGKTPKVVKRHFEAEVGVQYIFDVSDGCKLVEEKKHDLPVFPSTAYSSRRSSYYEDIWEDYYRSEQAGAKSQSNVKESTKALPPPSSANTATNALMQKYGIKHRIGDFLQYEMLTNHPYTGPVGINKGCIKGWLPNELDFIEVHEHNANPEEFEGDRSRHCVITSCFEMNTLLTLIARPLTAEEKTRLAGPPEPEERLVIDLSEFFEDEGDDAVEQEVCASGEVFTRDEWNNSHYSKCANCTVDIAFEDIPEAHILDNADACLCNECYKELVLEVEAEEEEEKAVNSFQCTECEEELLSDQESAKESLCKSCFDKLPARRATDKVTIGNGWTVTGALWEKMNNCVKCMAKIPFKEADLVKFQNGNPLCIKCSRRTLEKK